MKTTDIKKQFGATVKTWRLRRGLSQEKLAELAQLHRTYITDVESGSRNLSLESIERLAGALEISLSALFMNPADLPILLGDPRRPITSAKLVDILLVDDNHSDVVLARRAFEKAGLANHLHVVNDGAEAMDFLFGAGHHLSRKDEPRPQVMLLDLHLPKVSGLEVLRRVKSDPRTQEICVVTLTESLNNPDIEESRRLGASAHITKPINFDQLAKVMPGLRFMWALLKSEKAVSS